MPESTPSVCPVCDEPVPRGALACPECGADHRSGWREDTYLDGVDLPDDHFDYDEFVREEFANSPKPKAQPIWWITAVVLLLAIVAIYFR